MSSIRPMLVQVAHKNAVIQAGIRQILGEYPEFELEPPSDRDPAPLRASRVLDVVVLDHEDGVRRARSHDFEPVSRPNVLVVTVTGQELDVRRALECGVRGYVVVGCSAEEIVRAARAVASGRRYLCEVATLRVADSVAKPDLTHREIDVLGLVFRGHNNKEIARTLDISVGTVKSHMRGVLGKLGARCRTEAAWIASQRGLIESTPAAPIIKKQDSKAIAVRPPASAARLRVSSPVKSTVQSWTAPR